MTILQPLGTGSTGRRAPIDPEIEADILKFERMLEENKAGRLDDDVFRVFRLSNGVYGQRQGGTNQMVRVKVPYGSIQPEQLEVMGDVASRYSRGWGHITTRQNVQFHFVQLDEVPAMLRELGAVGLTTREACGDTVRNVQGCHLAGACPYEVLDITQWAEATFRHFLRNPLAQRLPRKFKINFSGCSTDCGQAMFNDVGVVAVTRTREDGTVEAGFRVYIAGGLGANPHPALALEEFTSREDLLATIESIVRVFDQAGNRDNKIRARMKWLVDTIGFDEVKRRILATRKMLPASATWPGGLPREVVEHGDAPAGRHDGPVTPMGHGTPVTLGRKTDFDRWVEANVVRGAANGTVSAYAWAELGDVTTAQFHALAGIQRELDADVRLTNRQNLVFRGLSEDDLPVLYERLSAIGMARPGAELSRDVVACPGADTCNLALSQSRGLAKAIGDALEEEGLAEVGGVRINISGCTNSCGQHHASDIGFFGFERRAHGRSAPGYQMLLGGYVGHERIHFGQRAVRLPAKTAAQAAVRVIRRFVGERQPGETFTAWLERAGGAESVGRDLKDLDHFPPPEEAPDMYIDYGETGPYEVVLGQSEVRDLTQEAFALIDAANAADPNQVSWRGEATPLALLQGRLASEWVERLVPDAKPPLRIAARAHHLRRWAVPRHTYPEGRAGYLRWRRDQKRRHAAELLELLEPLGLPAGVVERAAELVARGDLSDPEARAVEDAACLVFLQLQLDATAEQIADEDHVVEILRKSARKMSPAGLAAAATIDLSPAGRTLLERALAGL